MKYSVNNYELFFQLSSEEKIVLSFEEPIGRWIPCDNIPLIFSHSDRELLLSVKSIRESMTLLIVLLTSALKNKLHIDKSITKDIGFLWNQEIQKKPGLVYMKLENKDYWIGLNNLLWTTPTNVEPTVSTWIYNNSKGEIVLEITPDYPWHFRAPNRDELYVDYEKWISKYEPFVIWTISTEIATRWINQAQEILNKIDQNIKKQDK